MSEFTVSFWMLELANLSVAFNHEIWFAIAIKLISDCSCKIWQLLVESWTTSRHCILAIWYVNITIEKISFFLLFENLLSSYVLTCEEAINRNFSFLLVFFPLKLAGWFSMQNGLFLPPVSPFSALFTTFKPNFK